MGTSLQRVLVVYKKSLYQLYVTEHHEEAVQSAMRRRDPVAERLVRSHAEQQRANEIVDRVLGRREIETVVRWRGRLRSTRGFDLVLAVGGDGTVLDVARWIKDDTPLLGVNSDPEVSVGQLCGTTADELDATLDAIESGELGPRPAARLRIRVGDGASLGPCLNDALFAHTSPAEMSRFEMAVLATDRAGQIDPFETDDVPWQAARCSGIWIATATGATAAIRSAGGRPMRSGSRRLQYALREPYLPPHSGLGPDGAVGFIKPNETLLLINRMRSARVWADGPHRKVRVRYGEVVRIDADAHPLQLIQRAYRGRDQTLLPSSR